MTSAFAIPGRAQRRDARIVDGGDGGDTILGADVNFVSGDSGHYQKPSNDPKATPVDMLRPKRDVSDRRVGPDEEPPKPEMSGVFDPASLVEDDGKESKDE